MQSTKVPQGWWEQVREKPDYWFHYRKLRTWACEKQLKQSWNDKLKNDTICGEKVADEEVF